jgi:hypothetical protein
MRLLRYALGEIVLVVIGILVAPQINKWNEELIGQKEIRQYALNLYSAIEGYQVLMAENGHEEIFAASPSSA